MGLSSREIPDLPTKQKITQSTGITTDTRGFHLAQSKTHASNCTAEFSADREKISAPFGRQG